jgi:hypothetical protein
LPVPFVEAEDVAIADPVPASTAATVSRDILLTRGATNRSKKERLKPFALTDRGVCLRHR